MVTSKGQEQMNYPAASCGVSSHVLDRHSVLDTESSLVFWIPAFAGMTIPRQAAGNETHRHSKKVPKGRSEKGPDKE